MNEKQISAIEKEFAIALPNGYRQMLKSPPKLFMALLECDEAENPGQIPFFTDHRDIVGFNRMMRDPQDPNHFEFDPNDADKPWPDRYFIIGSDVGRNYYCIKPESEKSRVYFWYQGNTAFTKYSDDMAGFVKRIFRMYGELEAMDCITDDEAA